MSVNKGPSDAELNSQLDFLYDDSLTLKTPSSLAPARLNVREVIQRIKSINENHTPQERKRRIQQILRMHHNLTGVIISRPTGKCIGIINKRGNILHCDGKAAISPYEIIMKHHHTGKAKVKVAPKANSSYGLLSFLTGKTWATPRQREQDRLMQENKRLKNERAREIREMRERRLRQKIANVRSLELREKNREKRLKLREHRVKLHEQHQKLREQHQRERELVLREREKARERLERERVRRDMQREKLIREREQRQLRREREQRELRREREERELRREREEPRKQRGGEEIEGYSNIHQMHQGHMLQGHMHHDHSHSYDNGTVVLGQCIDNAGHTIAELVRHRGKNHMRHAAHSSAPVLAHVTHLGNY